MRIIIFAWLWIHVKGLINDGFVELIACVLKEAHENACHGMRDHDGNAIMLNKIRYVQSM